MYGFGNENTAIARKAGAMSSIRLGYAAGPLSVAFGTQTTNAGAPGRNAAIAAAGTLPAIAAGALSQSATDDQKWTTNFLAASYNLGVARVSAGFKTDKLAFGILDGELDTSAKSTILGVVVPMGATTLKASYVQRKADGEKLAKQFAFGAVHDLSKRTSLYGTYAILTNEEGVGLSVGSAVASNFTGVKSKGFEFGVKHNF
jgi:predicted porin